MIQYYLHIPDPSILDDHTWALKFAQLTHIRKKEAGK